MTDGLTASDVAVLSGNYGRNNNDGFGGDWGAWIILFLIFGMYGWGGFGGWGGGFGGQGGAMQGYATQADIQRGFDNQAVVSKLDGITQGICDSTYALNNAITNGFNNTNMGMMQGFNGVERGFCNISSQIADCCCQNREAIAQVRYDMAAQACDTRNAIQTSTRDLLENQNSNTRAILDWLCQKETADLRAENQSLKLAASQANQNAYLTATMDANNAELIRRINPSPVPAYTVPAPYPYAGCGYNGNCGC